MAKITGISHIDLTVMDLDKAEKFFIDLLDVLRVMEGRNEDRHFEYRYLLHESGVILGLMHHDGTEADSFDPARIGLDHLAFAVDEVDELGAWQDRLEELGVEHSGIVQGDVGTNLFFHGPDGVQLEFFYLHPLPASP